MPTDKSHEKHWFAYFLGEAAPEERAAIEAEMEAAPEEAADMRRIFEAVSEWAQDPVPEEPVSVESLRLDSVEMLRPLPEAPSFLKRLALLPTRAWPWAAAALVLLAASQASFSITFGDTVLTWGQPAPPKQEPDSALPELQERLGAIEAWAIDNDEFMDVVAVRTLAIEEGLRTTAMELDRNQRIETQVRHEDMQRLWRLTRQRDLAGIPWREPAGGAFDALPASDNR